MVRYGEGSSRTFDRRVVRPSSFIFLWIWDMEGWDSSPPCCFVRVAIGLDHELGSVE